MATNSGNVQHFAPQPTHTCNECGKFMNSAESLDVHLQYHKENLLNKWATQASTPANDETNNNQHKHINIKREFIPADSSDAKRSPPATTPDQTLYAHPLTPQSYQSAASPYQGHDQPAFSPSYFVKAERASPHYPVYQNFTDHQFFPLDQHYAQDFQTAKAPLNQPTYRYHPYQHNANSVSSSSPGAYPPQPTPSPSPKQCDKCGFVCDSPAQLLDHHNLVHYPTNFVYHHDIKQEEDTQSEILDLDSHKVHQIYQDDPKPPTNGQSDPNNGHPHSVTALLHTWPQKFLPQSNFIPEFTPPEPTYRPSFEPSPVSSSQPPPPTPTAPPAPKAANWKSNEARRPKTYNCTACNKWFTSSGHLKRHYNTTLHKNAVKSSGQPDPAALPISAHHHPARDPPKEESGSSPDDDSLPGLATADSPPSGYLQHIMPPPPPPQMDAYQPYPNGPAPHVTQDTATISSPPTSHSTIGEFLAVSVQPPQEQQDDGQENQPLPSFAQFQRYGGMYYANVGGGGPVTAPYTYYEEEEPRMVDEYRLTVMTASPLLEEAPYSPPNHNNNNVERNVLQPLSPEKAHTKRDYEENTTSSPVITSTSSQSISKQGLHKCIDCDKLFNKACYLTQHNKTFHSGDKPFKCTRCGKRFSSEMTYQEHLAKHAGEKPHKCDLCPKQFNHKTDLRRHMCLHTGQKPYSCDTCGKGFIRKDHMLKHCETHFRKSQNKMSAMR